MGEKALTLAADLYGCPNRCLHCWLSHMPNRRMEPGADVRIVSLFKPYFDSIAFYSWLREPDFCPDYRARWERDKQLSVNAIPARFELASFWRLARDAEYPLFLKEAGVSCVQLSFFGLEDTTDRYVGRKGAFRELLKATERLLKNGLRPRWQTFINEENREELPALLALSETMELPRRCAELGGEFSFFVHPGSCDGENRKLYSIRICKEHIPAALVPHTLDYDALFSEKDLCRRWRDNTSHVIPHNDGDIVLYVSNDYGLFFNFTHMRPEWRIGNLLTDPMDELIRRVVEEDSPALRAAREITLGELVRLYGDESSDRAFDMEDYKAYLLNTYLERRYRT